jgi:hypothetical protein
MKTKLKRLMGSSGITLLLATAAWAVPEIERERNFGGSHFEKAYSIQSSE